MEGWQLHHGKCELSSTEGRTRLGESPPAGPSLSCRLLQSPAKAAPILPVVVGNVLEPAAADRSRAVVVWLKAVFAQLISPDQVGLGSSSHAFQSQCNLGLRIDGVVAMVAAGCC